MEEIRDFPSIDEVNNILDILADEVPYELYEGLSGGISLLPQAKIHPEAIRDDLYIMGEYVRTSREKQIKIYYGSFAQVYKGISMEDLKDKLNHVLIHELTHHLEHRAGIRDLEYEDARNIQAYKDRYD